MFTYIRVNNYKSLVDLEVNLCLKKKKPKPVILIYGENGIGKSNFASIFSTLWDSMLTMSVRMALQQAVDSGENNQEISEQLLLSLIMNGLGGTESIIKNCKTINSQAPMTLEFGFTIEDNDGTYLIEYDNTKIIHEKLDYVLNKNKTNLYDISLDGVKINEKIFKDSEYHLEVLNLLNKYSGKHSLLSILVNETEDKAEGYLEKKIHSRLYDVIASFMTMGIKIKSGNRGSREQLGVYHDILNQLANGEISITQEEELNHAEKMLNEFFTLAYSDIKKVFYKKEIYENKIKYVLMFKKLIYGKIIDVTSESESTGTLNLIDILPFLLMSVEGRTVIIDELDAGIHDLLVNTILKSMMDSVKGQLIITTHNTMLLEADIDPAYIYTFMVDRDAKKTLLPISAYEDRTHPNLNYRSRYLKGMYGGVPMSRDIDFDELWDILN